MVISMAIDRYCYLTLKTNSEWSPYKYRITYALTEIVQNSSEIKHPVVRELFRKFDERALGLELHHFSDLPARSGIGSSSAFAVGMLHILKLYEGHVVDKYTLADEAIRLEREILRESVGDQDQIACAFGGLNTIEFDHKGWSLQPVKISRSRQNELISYMVLLNTGITRSSSEITKNLISNISAGVSHLERVGELANEALKILVSNNPISDLGLLLRESWKYKLLSNPSSGSKTFETILQSAIEAGALGGKLLGAGGGGFMLLIVAPQQRKSVLNALLDNFNNLFEIPFNYDFEGSKCIFDSEGAVT
jgi:D-glycero-alpha-D-manno-heptose-7-phosphate kinase